MPFNSFNFWLVFPLLFGLYWLIPSRLPSYKKWYLTIVSYLLYMNWKPAFAVVLLFVTGVTFYGAKALSVDDKQRRYVIIWITGLLSLLPLLIFKYYNFINESITNVLVCIGMRFDLPGLNWAIPVGISFFTFQAVGYLFDVYYKRIEVENSLTDYVLFVSFFPQVASGPISKASELLPQIKNLKPFSYSQSVQGLKWLLWGMFLKTVIADRLGIYVDLIYGNYTSLSGKECLLGSVFYSLQIYSDFAGYSMMAMGLAKLLGFQLINNFQRPYFAISVTEFWHRWHISLSRWLKDYVYIPLGGSRCGKIRNYGNILITFFVSGIWHGANWTFIIWGLFHGLAQIVEKAFHLQKCKGNYAVERVARIAVTFFIVNLLWIYFRMPTIDQANSFISHAITSFSGSIYWGQYKYALLIFPLVVKSLRDEFCPQCSLLFNYSIVRWTIYVLLFVMILLFGVLSSGQFIYVNF